jgi:hypothetical protein
MLTLNIKNKHNQTKTYSLNEEESLVTIELLQGDWIVLNQSSSCLVLEVLNDNDLKITFKNTYEVILKQFVKHLKHNQNMDIAPQFNDPSIIDTLHTKLFFKQESLLDIAEIKTYENLIELLNNQKELTIENGSLKQILHDIDNSPWKKEHRHIEVFDENFKIYSNNGFKVIVNL